MFTVSNQNTYNIQLSNKIRMTYSRSFEPSYLFSFIILRNKNKLEADATAQEFDHIRMSNSRNDCQINC